MMKKPEVRRMKIPEVRKRSLREAPDELEGVVWAGHTMKSAMVHTLKAMMETAKAAITFLIQPDVLVEVARARMLCQALYFVRQVGALAQPPNCYSWTRSAVKSVRQNSHYRF